MTSMPSNRYGYGGIVMRRSWAAMAMAAGASQRSCASMNRASRSRSSSLGEPADHSERFAGRCSLIVARARCRALLAAATLVSSSVAVSLAGQPSTSRAISAARCRGGSTCMRGQERELDRLALDDDRVRLVVGRRDLVEQLVRIRLEPRHLGEGAHRASGAATGARSRSRQTLVAIR